MAFFCVLPAFFYESWLLHLIPSLHASTKGMWTYTIIISEIYCFMRRITNFGKCSVIWIWNGCERRNENYLHTRLLFSIFVAFSIEEKQLMIGLNDISITTYFSNCLLMWCVNNQILHTKTNGLPQWVPRYLNGCLSCDSSSSVYHEYATSEITTNFNKSEWNFV